VGSHIGQNNYGLRCNFYRGLGHIKECCYKKKDPKTSATTTNYLEVMVDDEKVIKNQLDKICESDHDFFSHIKVPKGGSMKKGVNHAKVKVLSKDYIFHIANLISLYCIFHTIF
jgi:hypothetical protein